MTFSLHERLAQDSVEVTDLKLSQLRLMNDTRFPWVLLIPKKKNLSELHELSPGDRFLLMEEINQTSRILKALYKADKMNVGALGNIVPQLHIHVIARSESDPAWPGPVWGYGPPSPYSAKDLKQKCQQLKEAFRN